MSTEIHSTFYEPMFKNLRLGAKFGLILLLASACTIVGSGAMLSFVLQQNAEREIASKAGMLMQTMLAIRQYTDLNVEPAILSGQMSDETDFHPERIPSFSATTVFENLRGNEEYRSFFYKEAAPNPTNLRDKADAFEEALVGRFRSETATKEISGFREQPGGEVFYVARPLKVSEPSCLQCHSTPEIAPKSMLNVYGDKNGFGWKLGEIIAIQLISVPVEAVYASAVRSWVLVVSILAGFFVIFAGVITVLLRQTVTLPIVRMAQTAEQVSTGQSSDNFPEDAGDEIGMLGKAFNRMKASLEIAFKMLGEHSR
ncbi:c-type heme family protein [Gloeobacter violaceus]|uniref:c-type heme family protein n=1 Tax=Gloeobacter violaceus TaxID=33072 RepID=UPI001E5C5146|nr:DUF3365 domain-containing protein [Gloeobacter violaceus]